MESDSLPSASVDTDSVVARMQPWQDQVHANGRSDVGTEYSSASTSIQGRNSTTTVSSETIKSDITTIVQETSEVMGMLSFLRDKGKGQQGTSAVLEITDVIPLPLSAETNGWLQQDSEEDSSNEAGSVRQRIIPIRELDDPPDGSLRELP